MKSRDRQTATRQPTSTMLLTSLAGKVRNLPSFKSEALLPLFEAVINSIQAIEERGNVSTFSINVQIVRDGRDLLNDAESSPIREFVITDNGIGFTQINLESFKTADSEYKIAKGGKGVGRFLWLKAFTSVDIESVYNDDNRRMSRKIRFSEAHGICDEPPKNTTAEQRTIVRLRGFKETVRQLPSAYKTASKIAQRILEHCLSYYIAGQVPHIVIADDTATHDLTDLFNTSIKNNLTSDSFKIRTHSFSLSHIKLYETHDKMHNIVLCADKRDVKPLNLATSLGTSSQFDDATRRFTYALYITSKYLDEHTDNYRTGFDLPERPLPLMPDIVSMSEIEQAAIVSARTFLAPYLESTRRKKEDMVSKYIELENPALRAVPNYCPELYDELEPTSGAEKINEVLYRHKGRAEYEMRKRTAALLKTQISTLEEAKEKYRQLTSQITAFQRDNLVNYLCHRKHIIDLLERKLEINKADGKFPNEDIVHDIVFPRKATTDQIGEEGHHMWLIDEVLAFHTFAVSDKPLNETVNTDSDERPDIVTYAELDEDKIARSVSLVEFKKPQRKSFDKDPTAQLYGYVRIIRDGKTITLPNGRILRVNETTRYYCYAICDITKPIKVFVENDGSYATLKNDLGYYKYNAKLNAHTEILDFATIVGDSKRRHQAFFSRLGID